MLSQNKQRARPPPKPPAGNMAAGGEKKTQRKRKEKQHNCRVEERLAVRARAKADSLVSLHPLPPHHASGKPLRRGQRRAYSTDLESVWEQNQTEGNTRKTTQMGITKKKNGTMSLKGPLLFTPRLRSPVAPPQAPLQPTAGQNERPASFKTAACLSNTTVSTLQQGWSVAVRTSPPFRADQTASLSSKMRGVCYQFELKTIEPGMKTVTRSQYF